MTITARAKLDTSLKWKNYELKFRLLLHLEELQMEHDIRHYDLESVPMIWDPSAWNPRLLTLQVRTSVRCGMTLKSVSLVEWQDTCCLEGKLRKR